MHTAFVGRGPALAELAQHAAAAAKGHGSAVLVTGEPGIGKTTLVERATRDVQSPVLAGRAVADDGAPAYWPWLRLLGQPAAVRLGLTPSLLDLGDGGPVAQFSAADRTARALLAAAEPAGLVVVLDDLQWADEGSLRLLRHLCGELSGGRVLVLGTCRDPGVAAVHESLTELAGSSAVHVLRLSPLTAADTAHYLAAAAAPVADPAWADVIHRHSGGNPLFVRELVRLLVQEERLGVPAGPLPVPAELRRLVGYRLSRLGGPCHRLLAGAAAIGDDVDLSLLAASAPDADLSVLAEAVTAGVLLEDAAAPNRLRFSHGLVRQAAYESMERDERVAWHRRIAAALDDSRVTERAAHAMRAAVDPASSASALAACRAAAADATTRHAFEEAARWLRHAGELLGAAGATGAERAETLLDLAAAAYQDGQITEALARCEEAAVLAGHLDRADLLVRAAVTVRAVSEPAPTLAALCARARRRLGDEDSARHARVLAQHAWALAELADPAAAQPLSARALAMAERSGDRTALFEALDARHHAVDSVEWLDEHLALGARVLELAADRPDRALWAHLWRIDAGYSLGDLALVDAELRALDALADRVAWPLARWHLLRARASRALLVGDFAGAEATALAAREISARTQDVIAQGLFYAFISVVLERTGRFDSYPELATVAAPATRIPIGQATFGLFSLDAGDETEARRLLTLLRPSVGSLPRESRWLPTVALTAELAARLGDEATTATCYALVLPFAHLHLSSTTAIYGAVARALGIAAAALGRLDDADRHLTAAIADERRLGALPGVALAELEHAKVLTALGAHDRARAAADSALRTARALGMTPTATAAAALAGLQGGSVLTVREREIATLVARGMANRAIAESLVLSERTVETHVRNVLTKLNLANRTQVAGWALRAGL